MSAISKFDGLRAVLVDAGILAESMLTDAEVEVSLEMIRKDVGSLDHMLIPASLESNRALARSAPYADQFFALALADPRMDNSKRALRLPRRIDVETAKIERHRTDLLQRLHRKYLRADVAKFYMEF